MADAAASALLEVAGTESREVVALVWAEDEEQAEIAEDFLAHALWPYWYRFKVRAVRRVAGGRPCPLRCEEPEVLAFIGRERWAWVLVAPDTDFGVVASCT